MNKNQIEVFGQERDSRVLTAIKNTALVLIVILALLFSVAMASASTSVAYDATRINSQSGTNFNGSQYLRSLSVPINESNGFTAIVWASQTLNTTQATIFKYNTINTDFTGYISFGPTNSDWGIRMACSNCTDTLSSGTTTLPNLTRMYMMTFQFNGTHFLTYRNNNSEFSDDTALTGAETSGDIYVGALESGATAARANMTKILVYNRTLNSQEITNEYLLGENALTNNTYGLVLEWLTNQTRTGTAYSNSTNVFDLSYPIASFNSQTPSNNSNVLASTFTINTTITTFNLTNLTLRFNDVDYELLKSALVWLEFDNNSVLGENATVIKDTSLWNRQINITGATPGAGNVSFDGSGDYLTVDGLNIFAGPRYYVITDFLFKNKTLQAGSINSGLWNQRVSGTERNGSELLIYFNRTGTRNFGYLPRYLVFNGSNSQMTNNGWGQIFDQERYTIGISFNTTHYSNFLYGAIDSIDAQTFYPNNTNTFEIGTYGSATSGFSMNGSIYQFIVFNRSAQPNEEKNTYKLTKTSSNTYELIVTRLIEGNSQINFSIIANELPATTRTINANATVPITLTYNYSTAIKTINFSYGTQDSYFSKYIGLPLNTTMKAMYQNMSIDYYRIWVSNADTVAPATGSWLDMMPVGPAGNCQVYDYTNLTRMIQFTLNAGMTPHIMFVHIPPCWANYTTGMSTMTMMNITYNTDLWGNYTRNIRNYFEAECSSGNLTCTGTQTFDQWIWQIGNEPGGGGSEGNFSTYTTTVYIPAVNRLREGGKNPLILTGTFQSVAHMQAFFPLLNSSQTPQLGSFHFYDDLDIADPDLASFLGLNIQDALRQSTRQGYRDLPNYYLTAMKSMSPTTDMYNDEYSLSSDYSPHKVRFINETSGNAWMASSFYWQIAFSNITREAQFEGLGNDQFGFGIGVIKNNSELSSIRPLYNIRVKFADKFVSTNPVYVALSSDSMIESLSTTQDLAIINKYNKTVVANLSLNSLTFNGLYNESGTQITPTNNLYQITLQPFEVQFLTFDVGGILYVNISNGACSNSYTRNQVTDPSTPWCDISTAETKALDSDYVLVADGNYRDSDTYNFNANWNSTVTFQAQSNNTVITASLSSACEVSGNTCWTNASNSTHTNFWSRSIATGSTTVGVTYISTQQPILRCSNNNMSLTYATRGFECTWFNTTSQVLFLDLAPGINPRNTPFYTWKGDTISLDGVTNVAFKGFTIVGGEQQVTVGSGYPENITFENNRFLGGYSDTGNVDIRRVNGLRFVNNTIQRTQLTSWWWYMIKQANLGGETAGFYCEGACNNMFIVNNTISNYFNGIVIFNTTAVGNIQNITIQNNNITNIVDDGIELEGYGSNVTIRNNTLYDTYVAISLTSFNSTGIATFIEYNLIHAVKRINFTKSGSTFTTAQNGAFKLLANNSLVNAVINHNSIYGERVIGCYNTASAVYWNCMNNVNITNNVMMTENNYVLDGSGLNSSKVYYNYNLYFNATGGTNIFRYWNSGSSTSYNTLAQALASANNPGTWDSGSFSQSPLIANFLTGNFTPAGNSVLCNAGSDGTTIGAVECSAYTYRNVSVSITSANNTLLIGVDTFQVNYTVNGTQPTYCNVYIDGNYYSNQTTASEGNYNITGSISVGTHNYYLTCYDELFSESTTGVYSITLEKKLINGTRSNFVGSDTNCVGSNCGAGNSTYAFDGNLSTKADYVIGSSQYISNLYMNYSNPNGMLGGDLFYFLYCVGTNYSGSISLDSDNYNTGKVMLNGYLVNTGFKANYLAIYNGTNYENIGGSYICGSGGTGTHGIYETYINYTLNYAINFSNTNNSYSLKNQNALISASLLNTGSLGNQVTYTLYVYNSTNSIIYTRTFNATNNISVPVNLTSNGIYRYNITAENNTHYAISELYTLNVYDFTTTFNSPTSNQNFNNTLLINWTNTFTGGTTTNIVGTNITIDGRLIANLAGNSSVYLWNNTYNWNLSLGTHIIAVNVIDNASVNTNTTVTVNHTYNSRINITARTAIGGSIINSYSGWVYQSETGLNVTYNTTSGQALVDFTRGNITVYIQATNYSIVSTLNYASFNLTSGFYDVIFYQYETNALNITFYDEANPSVILSGVSINLELISDLSSGSYNTSNGTMYLPLLTAETYTLRYSAPRYTERFYTVTITNDSFQNIQLYLVNSTIAQNVSIYVVNQVLNPVENAVVKALKYNLPTNSYILQEIGTTDVNGRVLMTLTMNDEYYKFIVEYPIGTVQTITDPAYIISSTLTINIDFTREITEEYQNYKSITYDLSFNTLSNNFRLDYTDSNNLATEYCLYVYKLNNASSELYALDCETGASGTILIPVENNTGVVYEAKAVYTEDETQKFLASLIKDFPWINALANQYGLFLQFLISLAFASLFILNAGLAIIGLGFSLILGKILGLTIFGWGGLVAIQITCIIVGVILAMKK